MKITKETRPKRSLDTILAPLRKHVAKGHANEDELDKVVDKVRKQKNKKG